MIGITNSNTSTIYVGPTEPTSGVRIWLDTDEEGASAVNSVNGKAGTVVIDDIPMTLLWTNASPTSDFSAQTVAVDLSDYDFVYIELRYLSGATTLRSVLIGVGNDYRAVGIENVEPAYYMQTEQRVIVTSTTGVAFSDAYTHNFNSNTGGAVNNARLIPQRIYGIKGAITA